MTMIRQNLSVFLMCLATTGVYAHELDDAGPLPATSQQLAADGSPWTIEGTLDADDDADMYAFSIVEESLVSAAVVEEGLDTVLYLFDGDGFGLWGSDDVIADAFASAIRVTLAPGDYFVGISSYDNMPTSEAGQMFDFADEDQVAALDGSPISGWGSDFGGETGSYLLEVSATAASVPEPTGATIALLFALGLGTLRRRNRV